MYIYVRQVMLMMRVTTACENGLASWMFVHAYLRLASTDALGNQLLIFIPGVRIGIERNMGDDDIIILENCPRHGGGCVCGH